MVLIGFKQIYFIMKKTRKICRLCEKHFSYFCHLSKCEGLYFKPFEIFRCAQSDNYYTVCYPPYLQIKLIKSHN